MGAMGLGAGDTMGERTTWYCWPFFLFSSFFRSFSSLCARAACGTQQAGEQRASRRRA